MEAIKRFLEKKIFSNRNIDTKPTIIDAPIKSAWIKKSSRPIFLIAESAAKLGYLTKKKGAFNPVSFGYQAVEYASAVFETFIIFNPSSLFEIIFPEVNQEYKITKTVRRKIEKIRKYDLFKLIDNLEIITFAKLIDKALK